MAWSNSGARPREAKFIRESTGEYKKWARSIPVIGDAVGRVADPNQDIDVFIIKSSVSGGIIGLDVGS